MSTWDKQQEQILVLEYVIFINNSRKHANASQIIVQFSSDDHNSILYLEDNGQGFDPSSMITGRGLGLTVWNQESTIWKEHLR